MFLQNPSKRLLPNWIRLRTSLQTTTFLAHKNIPITKTSSSTLPGLADKSVKMNVDNALRRSYAENFRFNPGILFKTGSSKFKRAKPSVHISTFG